MDGACVNLRSTYFDFTAFFIILSATSDRFDVLKVYFQNK
jgi:hypothetical protein